MFEAEFWVAVAFVIFVGVLGYFGAHKLLLKSIDDRRERIKAEFDEARRLKAEAEALLATYRRKQQEAEHEAQAIVAGARTEAERLAAEAEAKIEEFVARRTKMAENKIAQAEAQALADVRSAAAEVAVAAAKTILARTVKDKVADDLLAKGIEDFKGKLNYSFFRPLSATTRDYSGFPGKTQKLCKKISRARGARLLPWAHDSFGCAAIR